MELRDPVCSASHLLTALWAAYATLVLVRLTRGDRVRAVSAAVFGGSMVLLYTASGVFHGVPFTRAADPAEFRFFQRLDQSAVFLLIAGTNTPCLAVLLGGAPGRRGLAVMWGLAAAGVGCLWVSARPPHGAVVGVCLGMGWLGFAPVVPYYRAVGWRGLAWCGSGGLLYSAGAVCELAEWPQVLARPLRVGFHEVFHLFCTAGSVAFFLFIARHVLPYPSGRPRPAGPLSPAAGVPAGG